MNTSLKISLLNDTQAQYRANEITRNLDPTRLEQPVLIEKIIDNEIDIKPDIILTDDEKKVRIQLQKNLHIYKKRLEKAIEDNKPKSINTNQKKVNEIEQQLKSQQVTNLNKKDYLEISLHLTNSNFDPKTFDHYELFKKFIEEHKAFSTLDIIKLAYHKDQYSPHAHILFDVTKIKDFGKFLKDKYKPETDTREIFSKIQNEFNDYVATYFSNPELGEDMRDVQTQRKGVKYMSKNQYKELTRVRDEILQETGTLINKVDYSNLILKRNIQDDERTIYQIDRGAREYLLQLPVLATNEITTKGLDSNVYKTGDTQIQSTPTGTRGVINNGGMQIQRDGNADVREDEKTEKVAQIFYKKTDDYSDEERNSSFEYVDIEEIKKIDIFKLLKKHDEKKFIEANIRQNNLLDIAKSFIELGFTSAEKIIKINYEKIKNYALEALGSAKDKNEFENLMQEKMKVNYFRIDGKDYEFRINNYNLDLNTLQISAENIINILDRNEKEQQAQKRPEDEQLHEKQDKTPLNSNSEPKNDTNTEPTIKKPHRQR